MAKKNETKRESIPAVMQPANVVPGMSLLTDHDIYLFKEGNHFSLYDKLGAHPLVHNNVKGTHFAVWAPEAERVSVIGEFNGWNKDSHLLRARWDGSGIWEGFIPGIEAGAVYKYHVISRHAGYRADKGDPFALSWEAPPRTASIVCDLAYQWGDDSWMKDRHRTNDLNAPFSVYEVHLGSWRRSVERNNGFLTYREMADSLADYVKEMGFTHVQFMPVMEHPFYGSWGYQTTGYFAPSSRYGGPQDFMYLVDHLHQNGIGVILDWVPSHFPSDEHGLAYFDGTHLYEHADPQKGFHPDWKSYIFNYGRHEVRAFLVSSALFWLEKYHIDCIRIDAVASMLYLDYSRKEGEWIPNQFGGNENIDAITFLRRLNEEVYRRHPDVQTIAEESTAWPMVSRPVYVGGLGFGMKWNMGWMHDTLAYFSLDPVFRKYHHNQLTFSIWYAFFENFMLSLSHDEVVHGKGSLMNKMPGDFWQKFANMRLLLGYMFTHPGKKLLFMGAEFGQWSEWDHEKSLDWHLLQYPPHQGLQTWMKHLNILYRHEPALNELDFMNAGFEWDDISDWEHSIVSYFRKGKAPEEVLLVVCNLTPVPRQNYGLGVPTGGYWREILNSDSREYGGSGQGNFGGVEATPAPMHGKSYSLSITLPPLGMLIFKK
jgi:1,4-alpha-glucan branching enzyme